MPRFLLSRWKAIVTADIRIKICFRRIWASCYLRMFITCSYQYWALVFSQLALPSYQQVLKLGIVYDPNSAFSNAFLGYNYYARKINNNGGLVVGTGRNSTTYKVEIIGHSNSDKDDPYWLSSGSRKFILQKCYVLCLTTAAWVEIKSRRWKSIRIVYNLS